MTTDLLRQDAGRVYRTLSTEELQGLRAAFLADRADHAADPVCVAFCTGRLALIEAILQARAAGRREPR